MIDVTWPWLFIVLPLPWFLRYVLPSAKQAPVQALKVPFFSALETALGQEKSTSSQFSLWQKVVLSLIWILTVTASSGIQWLGKPIALPQQGRNLMLAVDLSGSMRTPDMKLGGQYLTRIQVVKKIAGNFIQQRAGDRIGLILFGTRAYLQTPLTFDRQTAGQMLNQATIGIAGIRTAIGDAIGLAIKQLIQYPAKSKALILMTDGGNNAGVVTPVQAAEVAKRAHIKIYTIGLGAKKMVMQTAFGPQVVNPSSGLDIQGLKKVAQITGGQFFRADDGQALQKIYQQLNKLEPIQNDKISLRPRTPLYPWPLGLALFLSCLLFMPSWRIRRSV